MASERRPRNPASQRPPTSVARPGSTNRGFESSDPERQREATDTPEPPQSPPRQPNTPASAERPRRDKGVGTG